eukprot:2686935-Amphidinium_carterae.2
MPAPIGAGRLVRACAPKQVACGGVRSGLAASSQFGGGFDCAIKDEGGGRDAKRGGDWLTEDLGSILHSRLRCGYPLSRGGVAPWLARL